MYYLYYFSFCALVVKLLNLVLTECAYNSIMETDETDQLDRAKHSGVEHILEVVVGLNVASLIYWTLLLRYSVVGHSADA